MKSYKSMLFKFDGSKPTIVKFTGINTTKDNKGALYVFNNEAHVKLSDKDSLRKFFTNIFKNGICNGIPKEIGNIEDRAITSFVIDLRDISSLKDFINEMKFVFNDFYMENKNSDNPINDSDIRYTIAMSIPTIVDEFRKIYEDDSLSDDNKWNLCKIIYFDVYSPGYTDGHLTLRRNRNCVFDFVSMTGYTTAEEMKVAGSICSGVSTGSIKPAPFTIGPIIFNPIGNESINISSEGMTINYVGVLRNDPKNFQEFRVYLTLNFSPDTVDGKFIGRSQESYDNFVNFINICYQQSKDGKIVENVELPFIFDKIKVEIQGTNPDNIKAIDIATILYKAFINLTIENIDAITSSDSMIDPTSIINESDTICTINLKTDNKMILAPINNNFSIK